MGETSRGADALARTRPFFMKLLLCLAAVVFATAASGPALHAQEKKKAARRDAGEAPRMPADLEVVDGITFKKAGETELKLMLFLPLEKQTAPTPLVVYIHGGGWGSGDRYKALRRDVVEVIRDLNKRGFTCASVEYRLATGRPGGVTADLCVADCKDAVRFLARHAAEHGIDPARIGTFGSSAGGHLTLMTALGADGDYPCDATIAGPPVQVKCVAAYYPLVSFMDAELMKGSNFQRPQRLIPLLGGLLEEKRELAKKLSPIELLTAGSPPIFLAHGDADKVLSYRNSTAMAEAAKARGVEAECLIAKGADHGFGGDAIDPPVEEITRRTVAFFMRWLDSK